MSDVVKFSGVSGEHGKPRLWTPWIIRSAIVIVPLLMIAYGYAYSKLVWRRTWSTPNATPRFSGVWYSNNATRHTFLRAFFRPANQVDRFLFPDRWPLPFAEEKPAGDLD